MLTLFFVFLFEIGPLFLFGLSPEQKMRGDSLTTHSSFAQVIFLQDLLKEKDVSYIKHHDRTKLVFPIFPLASSEESSWADPIIPETFILTIPQGRVYSTNGIVLFNDCLIKELLWRWSFLRTTRLDLNDLPKPEYIEKRVVVVAQEGSSNYYHWMVEVLPKLAMLEESNISYDLLYVSTLLPFMSQTLSLFGINQEKIVEAWPNTYIEAEELIIPSAPALSCYTPKWIVEYLRNKLIPQADRIFSKQLFSKKVFVSRKKASYRRILNEDEVFGMLEPLGFVRYHLEDLTVLEQVHLFHHAEVIVAPHGAGLVNLVFAQPNASVIELFQEHEDDSFWYLSQIVGLNHHCIKTTDFKKGGGYTDTTIPLSIIKNIVNLSQ
ncbi:MAG: hypothetical protein RLZZ453_249 [Chlamydiota bacterium]|jgi:hypothetical protein